MTVTLDDVAEAARLLGPVAYRTPLLPSELLSDRLGVRVQLKAEHLQRTGSFKVRGAYVRLAKLTDDERARGVVAASAGNHAQGVAWAAAQLGIAATIVMPSYAAIPKVLATRTLGGEVLLHSETFDDAMSYARTLATDREAVLVHAFDDPWVIAGQATVGLEIAQDAPDAGLVVVPVGGGGLSAGVAVAVKAKSPRTAVIGVRAASIPATMADGAAVKQVGALTEPMLAELLDDMVEVDEEAISEAILWFLERDKQIVEGAGALPLAGLLSGRVAARRNTVLVCSGGNIDPGLLVRVIRHGLGIAGRYLFCRLRLRDRPGELQGVLALLAELTVNVVSVVHHRVGLILPVDEVEVELTLETRDRKHAQEVVDALSRAGYPSAV